MTTRLLFVGVVLMICSLPGTAEEAEDSGWSGSLGLSFVATGGNSDSQTLGLDVSAERAPDPWGMKLGASFIRAEQEGETTAERYAARFRGTRSLGARWSLFAGLAGEQDEFAGFDLRAVVEGGAAYLALTGPRHTLAIDGGLTWTREDLTAGAERDFLGALAGLNYAWQISETATLTEALVWLPSFDESSDWRATSETALKASLTSLLALKVGFLVRYDNEPVPGFDDTDTTVAVSLVVGL